MKQKNIFLLLGVLVIWVFVIKRVFTVFGKDPKSTSTTIHMESLGPIPEFRKDTFELTDLERDPFLEYRAIRKPIKPVENPKLKEKSPQSVKRNETSKIIWPKLQYFGFLKGDTKSEKLALIKIDNKLHRIRESGFIDDIKVVEAYKDSVLLKKNGTTKIIIK